MIEATVASIAFVMLATFTIGFLCGWLLTEMDFKKRNGDQP